ncbi:DegV family protein [Clostridium sp. ATCC 25772]|uniref:DegV family protein n=1 Tax=Clostridium senegalense TaxID=1465809 RepID=A0A6M0H6H0_9CLOT|nr:DegV family protein [Clostridium sp. ATCC 25772]NEU06137.1 DegV family protein [Clostridium senegalense]
MSVKIITDSTSYIPKEYIEKYDISIVSLNVVLNGKSYREVDLENNFFYKEMDKCSSIPTSSQPSVEEFYNIFENIVKNDDDIVGLFISSEMSGTYSTANLVKNMILENYPDRKVEIIDSRSNCMQMGFAAIEGARTAKEGKDISSVVENINSVINTSRFLFVPDTLDYLKKGGRIGGAAALFGAILQIRPILTVENGVTTVLNKVRTKKKAVDKIVETVINDVTNKGIGKMIVHHINCEEEGKELANRLKEKLNIEIAIQSIGPIIGLHVGPKSIGVAYYTEK